MKEKIPSAKIGINDVSVQHNILLEYRNKPDGANNILVKEKRYVYIDNEKEKRKEKEWETHYIYT